MTHFVHQLALHGLWPEYYDFSYLKCFSGWAFDQNSLDKFGHDLEWCWPPTSYSSPKQCNGTETGSVWQQQWDDVLLAVQDLETRLFILTCKGNQLYEILIFLSPTFVDCELWMDVRQQLPFNDSHPPLAPGKTCR